MNSITSVTLASFCLILASCAQKWDATQQAALSSVAVSAPVVKSDAYQKPAGKVDMGPAPVIAVPGGGFLAGAVVAGGYQLIVGGIGVTQQSMYENTNKDAISRVSGTVPADLSQRIRKAVVKELDTHSFFKGKVRDASPNRLVVTIDSYGYARSSKVDGKILMAPKMTGTFELLDAAGKSLLKKAITASATSQSRPLEDFANDRKLASTAFDEIIGSLAQQIAAAIDLKAGVSEN
ncbi:MAG: hypothetical protein V4689_04650 [Verrucomicrobiota bacterium]